MHHLPMLAWAYGCAISEHPERAKNYQHEYRHQILDFIATNPPRYGVNWVCTMDVGIRIVNWLITYDLFQALGATWDREFETIFKASVYEHGHHIINHLEWGETLRSNHYFADLAGLLFVSAYLPRSDETDAWLAFAVQELIDETEIQFHSDGSNFEGSTSYHRLSTEILLYSVLLCANLPDAKRLALQEYQPNPRQIPPLRPLSAQRYDPNSPLLLPSWLWEQLRKAGKFTQDISKPNGEIVQIGDNDSGRFLKLWPCFFPLTPEQALTQYANLDPSVTINPIFWDEQILQHQHLTRAISAIFNCSDIYLSDLLLTLTPEIVLIQTWLKANQVLILTHSDLLSSISPKIQSPQCRSLDQEFTKLCENYGDPYITTFLARTNIQENLTIVAYPDFGLYLYHSPHLFLSIRCGNTGQNGNGGHAHNDQLSIELILDGQTIIQYYGTYLYTPLPERRNQYRATKAHFTPQVLNQEQNTWYDGVVGLFSLQTKHDGQCLYFDAQGFLGTHNGFGWPVFRLIRIESTKIIIYDWGGDTNHYQPLPFSSGYGRISAIPTTRVSS
jgi:hypothetical protein